MACRETSRRNHPDSVKSEKDCAQFSSNLATVGRGRFVFLAAVLAAHRRPPANSAPILEHGQKAERAS